MVFSKIEKHIINTTKIFSFASALVGALTTLFGYLKGFAGCPYAVENVAKWGKIVAVPTPGCVVFYDFNADGKFDHTGIFEKDLGGELFRAIEGNTGFGNNSNGGEVIARSDRKYKNAIFILPNILNKAA